MGAFLLLIRGVFCDGSEDSSSLPMVASLRMTKGGNTDTLHGMTKKDEGCSHDDKKGEG